MFYHDEIVEASATKSRPGQSIGLGLKEIDGSKRIYVAKIVNGMFLSHKQLQRGDELLEVNGIPIAEFPNGLRDVQKFLQGEWSINIRVGRTHQNSICGNSQTTEETVSISSSSLCDGDHSSEALPQTLPQEESSAPRRGRTKLSAEGDQPLVDHSGQESSEQPSGAQLPTKRRGRRKSRESLGSLIREVRSRTPSGRSLTPSGHGPRRGRRPNSTHSRKDDSSNHSRSQSFKKTVSFDEQQQEKLSSPGRHKKKHTNGHKKKREKSKDSSNSHHKKKREKKTGEQTNNNNIRGVECTGSCVTLEMKDGNRVSVNPVDLMALMTEEDGKFVAISNRKMDDRPTLEKIISDKALAVPVSDDEDDDEHYDTVAPKLQDLRNTLQKKKKLHKTSIPTMNDCSSVENPWARRSMSTLLEDQISNTTPTSLRRLLGERLRTVNPKKWEESSMVSSTLACFTNLIDPGDLMKIRNFTGSLNGATVEIVCKSSKIPNSWDVRVLQKRNQRASDPNLASARLVSVSAENLRHFV
mmetsp:Transcript_14974/g.31058  ORF Transcript_14974/g.31058 Transcript_14974/m.31058 type:complete len:526 (-) Transcript_14974:125-1702(-)